MTNLYHLSDDRIVTEEQLGDHLQALLGSGAAKIFSVTTDEELMRLEAAAKKNVTLVPVAEQIRVTFRRELSQMLGLPENPAKAATSKSPEDIPNPEKPFPQHKSAAVTQAERLLELMKPQTTLFYDQYREPYATFEVNGHTETHPVRSKFFKRWAAKQFYEAEGKPVNSTAMNSALTVLEAQAVFNSPQVRLYNRVAWQEGTLLVDLSNEEWQAVKIRQDGWEIVPAPGIFRRFQHQAPQQLPINSTSLKAWEQLRKLINVKKEDWILVFGYIGTLFIPEIPHAIPVVHGPKGASKTTIFRTIRALVDSSHLGVLSFPRDKTELVQQLSHHWVAFFDNISTLPQWLSDCLCRAVSGDGFSKRELYSDDEDVLYFLRSCVGLNGINVAATSPDLLDRSILIAVERIPSDRRLSEREYWKAINKLLPDLLGSIYTLLGKAIAIHAQLELKEKPRMADFAEWAEAFCQAAGYEQGTFLKAYQENIGVQNQEAVSAHIVGSAIMAFMDGKLTWEGTATELLTALENEATRLKLNLHAKAWPKAAHALTRRLKEIVTDLAEVGLVVTLTTGKGHTSKIIIENVQVGEKAPQAPEAPSPSDKKLDEKGANGGIAPDAEIAPSQKLDEKGANGGKGAISTTSKSKWDARALVHLPCKRCGKQPCNFDQERDEPVCFECWLNTILPVSEEAISNA